MKKVVIFILVFISVFLVSCQGGVEETQDDIKIFVNSPLNIEINELDDYLWKHVVTIYVNDERAAFGDTEVQLVDDGEVVPGKNYNFVVIFKYNDKEYKQEFSAYIYEKKTTYTITVMLYNNQKKNYTLYEGESLDLSDIDTSVSDLSFDGWYYDPLYTKPYDSGNVIDKNITIYGKWIENTSVLLPVDENKIITDMNNYIDELINNTNSYIPAWNQEGFKGRWNYIDGVFLNSIVNLYKETNDSKYKDFFIKYINYYISDSGNFIHPETLDEGYRSMELDSVCASRILFDAYEFTNDSRYLNAIRKTYNELMVIPYTSNGINFSHKEIYLNQIWLDGMYMYVPFYARYANLNNDETIFNKIKSQYEYIRNNMFDEEKKLYYHGHDTTKSIFWANEKGNSKSFWLRSMGWYLVSLVDVLEYYPDGENKNYLINLLNEGLEGILQYQDVNSKMFYQIVDLKGVGYVIPDMYLVGLKNTNLIGKTVHNYLESSGSSMIAYAMMKASRMGYIDGSYSNIGKEIYKGIYYHSFRGGNLNDICITAGLGPINNTIRDGSVYYYLAEPKGMNDAKGVGPFIMAYLEFIKLGLN